MPLGDKIFINESNHLFSVWCLMGARDCAKLFMYVTSFNPHKTLVRKILVFFPFADEDSGIQRDHIFRPR